MPEDRLESKLMLRALSGEVLDSPPLWLMRQAGRFLPEYRAIRKDVPSFLDLCYTPELATEVTLQPIRRFGFDAAILFSDILVVPHGIGQEVWFEEGEGPKLTALRDASDIDRLRPGAIHDTVGPVYQTVRNLSKALPKETTLIGFAGAPWTVATYMIEGGSSRDFFKAKSWAYSEPERFQKLMDILVEATAAYLIEQANAGAEVVQLFDSWAGVLPKQMFERWVTAPTTRLVELFRDAHPDIPIIGFPRGAGLNYESYAEKTGVTAIGLDTTISGSWATQLGLPVQGNLDPTYLLTGGEAMVAATREILDGYGDGPFIFNLGHGVNKDTPPEHVAELVSTVRSWTSRV
ncbi:MAG: uroporphyrinogen decarboxylase [Alphaproteobacteria bacterium]|jgi:uroporphyrinogen decarboxylase